MQQFLDYCTEALELIDSSLEGKFTLYLKSRLIGDARDATSGRKFETVDEFKQYLRDAFSSSKTVGQLSGELRNEFQRKNESVLTYANRLKSIVAQIHEANRVATNAASTASFKAYVDSTLIDCFRAGLRSEITPRLKPANAVHDIVKDAINVEKEILRNIQLTERESFMSKVNNKRLIQVCELEEKYKPKNILCSYCGIKGHAALECRSRIRDSQRKEACQICKRTNHTASQCYTLTKCQVCNRTGHTARECRNKPPSITCQLCNKSGHTANYCRGSNSTITAEQRPELICQKCGLIGHTYANCRVRGTMSANTNTSNKPVCAYCKIAGHTIAECRKKLYNQGNGQSPRNQGATQGTSNLPTRSTDAIQLTNLLGDLIPSGPE